MFKLENIKPTTASCLVTGILAFFCIELMIFLLRPGLFMTMDTLKLAGIGLGLTAPVLISNMLIVKLADSRSSEIKERTSKEDDEKLFWTVGGTLTIIFVSLVSWASRTFGLTISAALQTLFILEVIFIIAAAFTGNKKK